MLYTSVWTFFILRKSSFRSWPCRLFFEIFYRTTLPPTQMIFLTDMFLLIIELYANKINCSLTEKACKFAIKTLRDSCTEIFLGVTKRIECLQQNTFDRFHSLDFDSEQVQWECLFNLNWRPWLRVLNMVFFTITWKATCMDKSILRNIVVCYQNKNP